MIGIGVVGYGYWGPNLVRNFAEVPGCRVVTVCDLRPERLALVRARYPGVETTTNFQDLGSNPNVDAIAIATPVSTHFDLAWWALQAGKHVLVEKPLTATSGQALRLIDEANRRSLVLMVDHTFIYTGAVRKIKELVDEGHLGELYYYDSVRINLGLFQHDVNVIWDLAVHDVSIMDYVLGCQPCAVMAIGMSHVPGEPENIAYLTFLFNDRLIAHIHVNWLAPVKVRQTLVCGSRRMIVYDDTEPSEKVKVYDRGIAVNSNSESVYQVLIDYRIGDMWAPHLDRTEALRVEALHFLKCIERGERPITGCETGLRVVRLLEAATQSLAREGQVVEFDTF
jgi:predicted dehydrogenase